MVIYDCMFFNEKIWSLENLTNLASQSDLWTDSWTWYFKIWILVCFSGNNYPTDVGESTDKFIPQKHISLCRSHYPEGLGILKECGSVKKPILKTGWAWAMNDLKYWMQDASSKAGVSDSPRLRDKVILYVFLQGD